MPRLENIDLLRGIGIFLVLLGHLPINGDVHMLIYTFHMPLFFFCSGLFFKKRSFSEQIIKDLKSILVPYLFFLTILVGTILGMSIVHTHSISQAVAALHLNPLDSQCYPIYHTIWFLICMFFVKEFFNLVYTRNTLKTSVLAGGYVLSQVLAYQHIRLPFFIDTAFGLTIFYAAGFYYKNSNFADMKVKCYIPFAILLAYIVCMLYISPFVNTRDNDYPWYLCILAMIPIISLYYLSGALSNHTSSVLGFMKRCGRSSLFIFALHGPIFEVMFPLMNKLNAPDIIQTIVLLIVAIPLCQFSERIINKYAPFLIGKF